MKTLKMNSEDLELDFHTSKALAEASAATILGEATCLSWFDRAENREAPAGVSECHDGACEVPGYIDYATSRGAELKVDVGGGAFVFCYLSVGDYADEE